MSKCSECPTFGFMYKLLNKPISEISISVRTINVLSTFFFTQWWSMAEFKSLKIFHVAQISEKDLLGVRGCGKATMTEIKDILHDCHLELGMTLDQEEFPMKERKDPQ